LICSVCGTEYEPGRTFCGERGNPFARVCSVRGTANPGRETWLERLENVGAGEETHPVEVATTGVGGS
jgi:hypothetical protein